MVHAATCSLSWLWPLGCKKPGILPTLAAPGRFADLAAVTASHLSPWQATRLRSAGGSTMPGKTLSAWCAPCSRYVFGIAAQVAQQARAACQGVGLIVHSFLFTTGAHAFARNWASRIFPPKPSRCLRLRGHSRTWRFRHSARLDELFYPLAGDADLLVRRQQRIWERAQEPCPGYSPAN